MNFGSLKFPPKFKFKIKKYKKFIIFAKHSVSSKRISCKCKTMRKFLPFCKELHEFNLI